MVGVGCWERLARVSVGYDADASFHGVGFGSHGLLDDVLFEDWFQPMTKSIDEHLEWNFMIELYASAC